ncbi:hypothetical protein Cni_G00142 [Canna indica]|uniref:Uncharacterized protein n=1 Tax=Canna indica TaxID=4628 RepID=A0AAQ3JM46_9LILI|nr:hypothetical protein Cni_G00142 [Canna indica]
MAVDFSSGAASSWLSSSAQCSPNPETPRDAASYLPAERASPTKPAARRSDKASSPLEDAPASASPSDLIELSPWPAPRTRSVLNANSAAAARGLLLLLLLLLALSWRFCLMKLLDFLPMASNQKKTYQINWTFMLRVHWASY